MSGRRPVQGRGLGLGARETQIQTGPFIHLLTLDLGTSECMGLQLLTYMLRIMALTLKSGCEVESVHKCSAQCLSGWLIYDFMGIGLANTAVFSC